MADHGATALRGHLWKMGGGKREGGKWNRRYFELYGDLLMYFHTEQSHSPARQPNGLVCLHGCSVSERPVRAAADGALRFEFALSHPIGDSLVLAAETKSQFHAWMEALQCCVQGPVGHTSEQKPSVRENAKCETRPPTNVSVDEAIRAAKQETLSIEGAIQRETEACAMAEERLRDARLRLGLRRGLLRWRQRNLEASFGAWRSARIQGARGTREVDAF